MSDPTQPSAEQQSGADQRPRGLPLAGQPHHLLEQAPVAPMDVDGLRATMLGLIAFAVGSAACAIFYESLRAAGNAWWLGVCLSGFGLGLIGLAYCQVRRDRRRAGRWDRD